MQTEARVGVVVEGGGGQRALNSNHGGVTVDGGPARKLMALHQKSQIGTVSQLLAGGVAGAVSKTCTAPLARLTILFQVQGMHSDVVTLRKASIWHEASRIVREEGFRAFWKGNLVTIAHRLPYSSISFYAFERYKNLLQFILRTESQRENMRADIFIRLVGGGLAGITAASVTYPLDLVRTRLAAQTNVIYYRGIWHALRTISREEGVFGIYKGLGASLLGVGPNLAISFSVYDTLRLYWQSQRPNDSTVLVSLACGSLSGIASSTGQLSCRTHAVPLTHSCHACVVPCRAKPNQLSCRARAVPCRALTVPCHAVPCEANYRAVLVPCSAIFVPRARVRASSDRAMPCRAQLLSCPKRARAGFFRAVPVPCRAGKARLTPLTPAY